MKAIIMAAGLGTRLRPLTYKTPKPLIQINGRVMLDRVIKQLVDHGATSILVNTHYLAEQFDTFLESKDYGVPVTTVFEKELLDTAGGLAAVRDQLESDEPVIIHNADVFSDFNITTLYKAQKNTTALATLATRRTTHDMRPFLVDRRGDIVGHRNKHTHTETLREHVDPSAVEEHLFCGVHAVSQDFLDVLLTFETKGVSITSIYLELIMQDQVIKSHDISDSLWLDIGTIDAKNQAEAWAKGLKS